LSILAIIVAVATCALVAYASAPPTPFMIQGYVFYENGSACNGSFVNITNQGTGKLFPADTNASYNYYQFILANSTDVNVSETLQFEAKSPDGSQSNITEHHVTQDEINDGGIFNFNITLEPLQIIFDTRAPANPYPSIFGTHNGTIKTEQTIFASKLYTYPCEGTGGHTEYAKICNESWCVETLPWAGYNGDWHNISFNESFQLCANVEYNYTIITGSYPQIIHKRELNATGGKITCTEFRDANGKTHTDRIPAIRLEHIGCFANYNP